MQDTTSPAYLHARWLEQERYKEWLRRWEMYAELLTRVHNAQETILQA